MIINISIIPGSITYIALPPNNGGSLAIATDSAEPDTAGNAIPGGTVLIVIGKAKTMPANPPPIPAGLDLSVWTDPQYPLEVYGGQLLWDPSPTVKKWFKSVGFPAGSEVISITQLSGGPMAAVVQLQ